MPCGRSLSSCTNRMCRRGELSTPQCSQARLSRLSTHLSSPNTQSAAAACNCSRNAQAICETSEASNHMLELLFLLPLSCSSLSLSICASHEPLPEAEECPLSSRRLRFSNSQPLIIWEHSAYSRPIGSLSTVNGCHKEAEVA